MRSLIRMAAVCAAAAMTAPFAAQASSHMDAPSITLDDAANTTDVYAFVSERNGIKYLQTALAVYPFEEPGIGPNAYQFDDDVRYEIHVSTGDDVAKGLASYTYRFEFKTRFRNENTVLQSYLGVVQATGDANQNRLQTYEVTRIEHRPFRRDRVKVLGSGQLPPNNQGIATPFYNQGDNGENPAKDGVSSASALDVYTKGAIATLAEGHRAFAGQRDDGFYADIQGVFDLLQFGGPNKPFDSQGGFNVHMIALEIPIESIGGDQQVAGVYATTSRPRKSILRVFDDWGSKVYTQVGRQGNPLFCEGLVAIADKDLYNRTDPFVDKFLFAKYANTPELAALANAILFGGTEVAIENDRTDIQGIFIPDLIKVDLSTGRARLAGSGPGHPMNPDDDGFSNLSIFGGDVLISQIQDGFGGGAVPGGWPNGRRFGDDVVDIALTALVSDLRDVNNLVINLGAVGLDGVSANDIGYNKVFPYAATPLNGRNHPHH